MGGRELDCGPVGALTMGILLSWICRRYWLGLAGLGSMVLAILLSALGQPQVGRLFIWLGMALMLVQLVLRFRNARREAQERKADRERKQ